MCRVVFDGICPDTSVKRQKNRPLWDGAPAHRAKKLRVPEGITLLNFPAYTPQFNPSERPWSGVKESIANERQENIEQLEDKLIARCQKISAKPEQVNSLTSYHWWSYA